MSRPLRILYPNAWYHVMNRGARKQDIFKKKIHRIIFLELLEECHRMFNLVICAYCLMDNHYHLLVSTPDANLSRAMRHLNGVYTQKFNQTSKTDGALFRGRYKAKLIEDDCYQLLVSRYIHLNPTEAGLVENPVDYEWSSYPAYLGKTKKPVWLETDIILNQMASTKSLAHVKNYQDYVEDKNMEEINVYFSSKYTAPILGSTAFKEKILAEIDILTAAASSPDLKRSKSTPSLKLIIEQVCQFYKISYTDLIHSKRGALNWPKIVAIYLSRKHFGHTLETISKALDYGHRTALSTCVLKGKHRLQTDPHLQHEIKTISAAIKKSMLKQKA